MIKVLVKVDAVLGVVGRVSGVGFGAIRQELGLNKATLSQILSSMVELGWLRRDAGGAFHVGERLLGVARPGLGRESVRDAVAVAVDWLALATGEMASASALIGDRRVCLAKREGHNEVRVNLDAAPSSDGLWEVASGRVLLAFQPEERRLALLEREAVEREEALAELDDIRRQGVASRRSPNGQAVSFARGVFAASGDILATIGLALPAYDLSESKRSAMLERLAEAAAMAESILQL